MARAKKANRGSKRVRWTRTDLKTLRQNAGKKTLDQLARLFKRTPAAIRWKASTEKISLRLR